MIAIITDPTFGGTFLSWSLHWLAGHDQTYSAHMKSWVPLVSDPMEGETAHGFKAKNQPLEKDHFDRMISHLDSVPDNGQFHTVYMHNFKQFHGTTEDMVQSVRELSRRCSHIIAVTSNRRDNLYTCKNAHRAGLGPRFLQSNNQKYQNLKEYLSDCIDIFWHDSSKAWQKDELETVWDLREFLALNQRPFMARGLHDFFPYDVPHYYLDSAEYFTNFDLALPDLMAYLGITAEKSRLSHWHDIYQRWKKLHHDRLRFVWYFDRIIQNIIAGVDMDLKRFNLDLFREAAIQHALIYQHGLNLKTWQLEKFINTRQLHALLEPNQHVLGDPNIKFKEIRLSDQRQG